MFSQTQNTQSCALCNGTDFFKEDGYYFCTKCQTQNEDVREEVVDFKFDTTTRLRKVKIKSEKLEKADVIGWTSWELYNFVLIGITNELIEIGADPTIKLTILQLWTIYLTKLEVAFVSKSKKCIPKMARRYHKKDAEIIYGKIQQKRKRKRNRQSSNTSASSLASSFVSDGSTSIRDINKSKRLLVQSEYDKYLQSQTSSDTDGLSSLNQSLYSLKSSISQTSSTANRIRFNKKAKLEAKKVKVLAKKLPHGKKEYYKKKYVTTQYAMGPDIITPLKLWSIIYLALRIHNQDIYLSDMLRFSREGHLSYYKLDHLLPPEISLTRSDINLLTQTVDITHKGLRRSVANIAKFLNIEEIPKPNILSLIKRYCEDLELPRGIHLYAERIFLSSPSIMNFTAKSSLLPNYEGRAMAYIIVVLKILYSLDNITEKEISRVVEKINRLASEREILTAKLFSFMEWQNFIESRKNFLINLHFPSKIKYDPECVGTSHLYLRFMGFMKSKREGEPTQITDYTRMMSQNLVNALHKCIDSFNDNSIPLKEMETFSPSFTPLRSYITQLMENPHLEIPNILRTKFYDTKIGYMTRPDSLIELASQCGVNLEVIDHSLQFLEKIVPPFEQPRIPTLKELSEIVRVKSQTSDNIHIKNRTENLLDYSHRNRLCKLKINFENLKYYSLIHIKPPGFDEILDLEENNYFNKILSDGRLDISQNSDSEDEYDSTQLKNNEKIWKDNTCLLNKEFCKKYNIELYNHEIDCLLNLKQPSKIRYKYYRDEKGKFVKFLPTNLRENNKKPEKKKYKRIEQFSASASSEDEILSEKPENETRNMNENNVKDEIVELSADFDLNLSDISILQDYDIENLIDLQNNSINDNEILFRPYKNYWMYHCTFSRVKGKNFELFEKELPENFLWLLNECANIVEMTTEDLYEEVCLIEGYFLNINKSKKLKDDSDYEFYDCSSKAYVNNILNKW